MHRFASIAMTCSLFAVSASPAAATREENVAALVRATGMQEILENSRESGRAQARQMSDQMIGELVKEGMPLTPEVQAQLAEAVDRFVEACIEGFDVDDAIASWGRLYAASLTDAELEQILAYYTSPIGRRDLAASKAALPQWQQHLSARSTAVMQAAIRQYAADLREIAAGVRKAQE